MSFEENNVQEWLSSLKGLDVEAKKMFGCFCLYCDGQAVGWIHDSVLSLREVDLDYLPDDIKNHLYYHYGENKLEQATKEYWSKIKGEK